MLCATAAVFFMVLRNGDSGSWSLAPLIPGFMSCVWLVLTYHSNASNPSVMSFACRSLPSAPPPAWYFTASFAFQFPPVPKRPHWFSLLTVMLSVSALADSVELYQKVLLAASALWFLVRSTCSSTTPSTAGNTRSNLIIVTKACLSSERQAFLYKSNSNSWQFSI